jgi:photosystem II stability/assembly factor-like uncharacterized protein
MALTAPTHFVTAAPVSSASISAPLERPSAAVRDLRRCMLIGACRAGKRIVAVGERGIVAYSDDESTTWKQAGTPVSVTLAAIRFSNSINGIAVGHAGVVLTSDDAGQNWARRTDGLELAVTALRAAEARHNDADIKVARRFVVDGADKPLLDVEFLDENRALVVGAYGLVFETNDGGRTWLSALDRLDNPKGLHLYTVRRHGHEVLIAGEQGAIFYSADSARTFRRLVAPFKGTFFTAELLATNSLFVAGLQGNAWESKDAGLTWAKTRFPDSSSVVASASSPDGRLLMATQGGRIWERRSGGKVLNASSGAPLPPLNAVIPVKAGVLALTAQGVTFVGESGPPR